MDANVGGGKPGYTSMQNENLGSGRMVKAGAVAEGDSIFKKGWDALQVPDQILRFRNEVFEEAIKQGKNAEEATRMANEAAIAFISIW